MRSARIIRIGLRRSGVIVAYALASASAVRGTATGVVAPVQPTGSCFILYEVGVGQVSRHPASTCDVRVTPQSTFKIPHALAALDAGVVTEGEVFKYDGHSVDFQTWRSDHTLATALRYSVVWYFQEVAQRLGRAREREYLERFDYGNKDASGELTSFWLGSTLAISPDEQERFLLKLYTNRLPVSDRAAETVRRLLVQPPGHVTTAAGGVEFAGPWAGDVIVSAKSGSGPTADGRGVRWLVGHVRRGQRAWLFVSNVIGSPDLAPTAAIDQASRGLTDERVVR